MKKRRVLSTAGAGFFRLSSNPIVLSNLPSTNRVVLGVLAWYTTIIMQTTILNYRIIINPDVRTGTNEPGFTALCPTLGVADDGDTIDEALENVKAAIECFVESLIEDGLPVPKDEPDQDIITTTRINVRGTIQYAQL